MKHFLSAAMLITAILVLACAKKTPRKSQLKNNKDTTCGTLNGRTLYKDVQRNCYLLNDSGLKEYVDNSACSCI